MSEAVALVVPAGRPEAADAAHRAASSLRDRGVVAAVVTLDHLDATETLDDVEADLLVSLGGDGTFLRAARRAHELDVPILGVNFGRVGYLLNVAPTELDVTILATLAAEVRLEERTCLQLEAAGLAGGVVVVNEVSLEKTVPGHVVRVATRIDGEPFLTFAADGVLVATPTGSTAYNLSAGGPVLAPQIDGFVVTPVAPHFVIDRSIVLQGDQTVALDVVGDRPAICVVDGVSVGQVDPGQTVALRRHTRRLRAVVLAETGIGQRLRESLRQGHE
jgi:NAD+ kinase